MTSNKNMNAEELTLNIAVNLGRLARWVAEGKFARVRFFLEETEEYLNKLEQTPRSDRFDPTFNLFKTSFQNLKSNPTLNSDWAEEALTWANILTHRAKLA